MKQMILMSVSKYRESDYLEHTIPWLNTFLQDYKGKKAAFIPYAGVRQSYDQYEEKVQKSFSRAEA